MSKCSGITTKGVKCTRLGKKDVNGYKYCAQHAKIEERRIKIADPNWIIEQNKLQKIRFEDDKKHLYKRFGYNQMGILYIAFGGNRKTSNKKATVYEWLLVANRLKRINVINNDAIKYITYLLLRSMNQIK